MKIIFCLLLSLLFMQPGFAENDQRYRVIISTDIGGTDPDDFQSMIHLLLYADTLGIEGLISSPFGPGRKQDIMNVIDLYEKDYRSLRAHSKNYPSPNALRSVTKQGEIDVAPYAGYRQATEGSQWIIQRAKANDPRPLYLLIWGGIEDLAQALHDAPDILPKLRVYWIGGPNKKWSPDAYQYIASNHPELWIIETNASYRGWFTGGNQEGEWGNQTFVNKHIKGRGALGDYFAMHLEGTVKMGDSPSVGWLLHGDPTNPSQPGWGGQFVRAWTRPHNVFYGLTNEKDQIEEFGILELVLSLKNDSADNEAHMIIENQKLKGYIGAQRNIHFRFSPKAARKFTYSISSNITSLNRKTGSLTAIPTQPGQVPDNKWPNWWTDNPALEFAEGPHIGAKTVSRWRKAYLNDFADRMKRCLPKRITKNQ